MTALGCVFVAAWLLCGCTIDTALDDPRSGVVFLVALVVCVVIAAVFDRKY